MPVVRYGNRKVATDALPGVRKSAAETPESTGVGLAQAQGQAGQALQQLGATVAHIGTQQIAELQAKERARANDVAAMEYDTSLSQWSNKRLMDSQTGALTVMGKDALGQPEKVLAEFDQVAGTLEANLHTDEQRARAQKIRAQHRDNLDVTLQRHTFDQVKRYEADVVGATVETAHETAAANATDPRRVGVELQKGVDALTSAAPRFGWAPEVLQKKIGDFHSATHTDVIERLVDAKLTMQARVYFEEKGAEITDPKAHARVVDILKVGATKSAAQKLADDVLSEGGTLTEQRAKIKARAEGDDRDLALQYIEHEAALKERTDREADESLLDRVYARLKQNGGDLRSITAAEQLSLGRHLPGLKNFADDLARGIKRPTDLPTYYALVDQATSDPETFAKQNLLNYTGKLDEGELKHFIEMQGAIRVGNRKALEAVLPELRTRMQVVDDALTSYHIDPKAKPGTPDDLAIAQLRRMLDDRVDEWQRATGKKATNDDVQALADSILSVQETTPGSWWGIFGASTKRLIDTTLKDIPPARIERIKAELKGAGRPVSDATILNRYLDEQRKVPR